MRTRVQKWGNSQGVRVSRDLLSGAGIEVGDPVEVAAENGALVIRSLRRVRGGHDLSDLVDRIPAGYHSEELDWGGPRGGEVW